MQMSGSQIKNIESTDSIVNIAEELKETIASSQRLRSNSVAETRRTRLNKSKKMSLGRGYVLM